jgi:hypothetical protein
LREWLERAAAGTLNRASDENHAEVGGGAAGEGGDREDDDAGEKKIAAAEFEREPSAGGKDDGVGDEVAGENPGCFVSGGGEATSDVWKRDGGDGGVENFHERRKHDGGGDQVGGAVGAPRLEVAVIGIFARQVGSIRFLGCCQGINSNTRERVSAARAQRFDARGA